MPQCAVCEEPLQPEQKTCHVCGSNVANSAAAPYATASPVSTPPSLPPIPASSGPTAATATLECPSCGKTFDDKYEDEFCPCGTELRLRTQPNNSSLPSVPVSALNPTATTNILAVVPGVSDSGTTNSGTAKPAVGTVCIVVYSDEKPRVPLKYVPVTKDVLLIGRQDAVRGDFPDVDLGAIVDESVSRKISRRHVEILRARDSKTYSLRPIPGNTGTQVGKELAVTGQTYTLTDGTPIILGGAIWIKFETIK